MLAASFCCILQTGLKPMGDWVQAISSSTLNLATHDVRILSIGDLRDPDTCRSVVDQRLMVLLRLAAGHLGGAGFVFTGENDAAIMDNSALINLNKLEALITGEGKAEFFHSSSACMDPVTE